ncbi:hypothetical protein Tco_0466980 [Tanacetum coccineum]
MSCTGCGCGFAYDRGSGSLTAVEVFCTASGEKVEPASNPNAARDFPPQHCEMFFPGRLLNDIHPELKEGM